MLTETNSEAAISSTVRMLGSSRRTSSSRGVSGELGPRGASSWAVGVSAPAAQWARQRAEVLAVLADVALP